MVPREIIEKIYSKICIYISYLEVCASKAIDRLKEAYSSE